MLEIDTQKITHVASIDWLYGFILHYLQIKGETHKHDLMKRTQVDVHYTFPNLNSDYFYERYSNSDNVFMTLFYFAVFHLREKGYGLIHQKIKGNEPVISLSSIGYEFLSTPEAKKIFIDYRDIEAFLHKRYPEIYKRAFKQIEQYRTTITKIQNGREKSLQKNKGISSFFSSLRIWDVVLVAVTLFVLTAFFLLP